jgi:hypothetical protein
MLMIKNDTYLPSTARSMLSGYNLSHSFWAEEINTACYYSNCLCCHPMMEKTPYELFEWKKAQYCILSSFWLQMLYIEEGIRLSKFEKKCDKGFLLGYSTTSKAYRV